MIALAAGCVLNASKIPLLLGADEGDFVAAAVVRGRPEGTPAPLVVEEIVTLTEASVIIDAFDPAISLA